MKGFAEELVIDLFGTVLFYLVFYQFGISEGLIKGIADISALLILSVFIAFVIASLTRSLRIKVIFKTSVPLIIYSSLVLIIALIIWVIKALMKPDQISIEGSVILAGLLAYVLLYIRLKRASGEIRVEFKRYRNYLFKKSGLTWRARLVMNYSNEFIESIIKAS